MNGMEERMSTSTSKTTAHKKLSDQHIACMLMLRAAYH